MHPDDELASLRRLLDALESRSMKLLLNGRDVTQEEVAKLKPDIVAWVQAHAGERVIGIIRNNCSGSIGTGDRNQSVRAPGERNGQYRHGERTKAAIAERRKFSILLKMLRAGLT